MVLSDNIGLVDVVFRRAIAGRGQRCDHRCSRRSVRSQHLPKACQRLCPPSKAVTSLLRVASLGSRAFAIHDRLLGNVRPQSEPAEQRRTLSERLMTKDQ